MSFWNAINDSTTLLIKNWMFLFKIKNLIAYLVYLLILRYYCSSSLPIYKTRLFKNSCWKKLILQTVGRFLFTYSFYLDCLLKIGLTIIVPDIINYLLMKDNQIISWVNLKGRSLIINFLTLKKHSILSRRN